MIHSLSGGVIKDEVYKDFAKVMILEGDLKGKQLWFVSNIFMLLEGDKVIVPIGTNNTRTLGKVVRIDKNVSTKCSPIPSKHAKEIVEKVFDWFKNRGGRHRESVSTLSFFLLTQALAKKQVFSAKSKIEKSQKVYLQKTPSVL